MNLFNVKSAEFLATFTIFNSYIISPIIGWGLWIYLFTTRFWWISVLYVIWYYYDQNTPDTGGRPLRWLQRNKFWRLVKDYFSTKVTFVPDFDLDPKRNYLLCCFPHGVIPCGAYIGITNGGSDFRKLYPKFEVQLALLRFILYIPFAREIWLGIGLISCTSKSISHILKKPEGGRIVVLCPGGAEEAYHCGSGQYKFVVKDKKGFIKVALRTGAPLIPAITFGETELFQQVKNERIKPIQEYIRKVTGMAPLLFYGRGITENSVGWTPRRKHLMIVFGKPIEVTQTVDPTNEEVDKLHQVFVEKLVNLFDSYKEQYTNCENCNLILE